MIALGRFMLPGDARVRGGGFEGWRPVLYGRSIDGSRIGMLGGGAVGRAIARKLAGFALLCFSMLGAILPILPSLTRPTLHSAEPLATWTV
jgi:hypothetical protein